MDKELSEEELDIVTEGKVQTVDEELIELETLEVGDTPQENTTVDKDEFETYKTQYEGQIQDKCLEDYGQVTDKYFEDTAKEMYLLQKTYIPEEDKKPEEDLQEKIEKVEESKELKTEDIDEDNTVFSLYINTSNDDFQEDIIYAISEILNNIANNLEYTDEHTILDSNGNEVGKYGFNIGGSN